MLPLNDIEFMSKDVDQCLGKYESVFNSQIVLNFSDRPSTHYSRGKANSRTYSKSFVLIKKECPRGIT